MTQPSGWQVTCGPKVVEKLIGLDPDCDFDDFFELWYCIVCVGMNHAWSRKQFDRIATLWTVHRDRLLNLARQIDPQWVDRHANTNNFLLAKGATDMQTDEYEIISALRWRFRSVGVNQWWDRYGKVQLAQAFRTQTRFDKCPPDGFTVAQYQTLKYELGLWRLSDRIHAK